MRLIVMKLVGAPEAREELIKFWRRSGRCHTFLRTWILREVCTLIVHFYCSAICVRFTLHIPHKLVEPLDLQVFFIFHFSSQIILHFSFSQNPVYRLIIPMPYFPSNVRWHPLILWIPSPNPLNPQLDICSSLFGFCLSF